MDFGIERQLRIGRALRASPTVRRAIPLSDADKLMLACMDSLASQIAVEAMAMGHRQAYQHAKFRITAFLASLDDISPEFATETRRYLTETVYRLNLTEPAGQAQISKAIFPDGRDKEGRSHGRR